MYALDYDTHIPGSVLKAAGYTEVFRYLTDLDHPQDWPKGLTLAEVEDLKAHGIKIHLNRETTAKFMLGGYDLGYQEAKNCRAWATRLGFSANEPIIYSADFQVFAADQILIDGFNRGAAYFDGKRNVWNYGQYSVVKRCMDLGYGGGWQITNSWSWDSQKRLQKDSRAYAYQLIGGVSVGGVICDRNEINPNYQNASANTMSLIPDTIAKKWPGLATEFPPNAPYDDSNATIWADAGARWAAKQADVAVANTDEILNILKLWTPQQPQPVPTVTAVLSDADKDDIAHRVVALLNKGLNAVASS